VTTTTTERYQSIDAVRGFAVLGILLMNIVGMGLPTFAYVSPAYWGGHTGADLWAWAINYVLSDGKFRGLFTMLFGASMLLITDRAEGRNPGPAATHYRRVWWLFVIGMLHAYFLFFGDILVTYALAGALVFPLRKLGPKTLIGIGVAVLLALLGKDLFEVIYIKAVQTAVAAGTATPGQTDIWTSAQLLLNAPRSMGEQEIQLMRGGFLEALQSRAQASWIIQTQFMPTEEIPEAVGQMLIGAGLFRLGFFTLGWSSRAYARMVAVGYLVGVPVTAWLAWKTVQVDFEPVARRLFEVLTAPPRPFIALAHASLLMLIIRSGALKGLVSRLEAAGRMAFSNYLSTSIITSFVFCGYGLGLYGQLHRAELYWVVLAVWAFILLWSKPWLARFHYGPFEWLWRSLVMGKPQPFVKR
jgi:uncharacterized protein